MLENLVAWYPQDGISNSSHSKAFLHLVLIGLWILKLGCTQYGFVDNTAFKNVRATSSF